MRQPINPKKYSCYDLKKSYKEFATPQKFPRLENSPLPP